MTKLLFLKLCWAADRGQQTNKEILNQQTFISIKASSDCHIIFFSNQHLLFYHQ